MIALSAGGAGLEQWLRVPQAAAVSVPPGLHIIQSIPTQIQRAPELVILKQRASACGGGWQVIGHCRALQTVAVYCGKQR